MKIEPKIEFVVKQRREHDARCGRQEDEKAKRRTQNGSSSDGLDLSRHNFFFFFIFSTVQFFFSLLLSETKSLAIGFDLVMVSNYTIINEK